MYIVNAPIIIHIVTILHAGKQLTTISIHNMT